MSEKKTFICTKMDLALNNLQWLMCHKTKPNQTKPNQTRPPISKSFSPFIIAFVTVPSSRITFGIPVTFIFHRFSFL